jgi:hypothetical protein
MNGIDPVIIATGNDWRAIEAGAHAYAARDGRFVSCILQCRCERSLLPVGLPGGRESADAQCCGAYVLA